MGQFFFPSQTITKKRKKRNEKEMRKKKGYSKRTSNNLKD